MRQLAMPRPFDLDTVNLADYKGLIQAWRDWATVTEQCRRVGTLSADGNGRGDTTGRAEGCQDVRIIDLAEDGRVVGAEILSPSRGVDLAGLPHAPEIARALRRRGFRVLTSPGRTLLDQGPG